MGKKQFKTESKRILDLMIGSIYTHKEIFLREIISNASDAIDKLSYRALTDDSVTLSREDYKITVTADKDARTITVADNGIGMTAEELESNLGVIAHSGSLKFKSELSDEERQSGDVDIIGQFGVGFYSAFMVADKVTVISRAYGADSANRWESTGADGYTITPAEKETAGTEIIMHIKPDTEGENYSEFLEDFRLKDIIKRYSDYVHSPIVMGEETINSMVPVWQRSKTEATDEDCISFYKEKFHDYEDPVSVIRVNAEGSVSYKAMLFIPSHAPYDYYTQSYRPGLQLYTSGVMIMDKCEDLVPEHFRFVQGVVDSQDLSLNISREMLQHDRQLKIIAQNLEKKIKSELKKLMDSDREKYLKFYGAFGLQLKYGVTGSYGMKKDLLADLLLFWSSKQEKLISLSEYVEAMPEEQKYIYFAAAESNAIADGLPQAEPIRDKDYDILYMTDSVDEFAVSILGEYSEKAFKSVNDADLGLESDEEKAEAEKTGEENTELLDFVRESLGGKITSAKISTKLKSHPVCLTTAGAVSLEMERYFSSLPTEEGQAVRAERVLEINARHPVFESLKTAFESDKDRAKKYSELLYGQALLIAGLSPENPAEFAALISELMV